MQQLTNNDPLKLLTTREMEIFNEAALGWSNPEIAGRLKISEATVRTHMANVLDKLVLRDRTQITIYALKRGLIHLEDLP
jgi:NarL family two-component system response regulator LiaR